MSNSVTTIVAIVSVIMWIAVSRESVRPSKEINWRKMIILLSAGSLSTLFIIFSLFQGFPF